MSKREKRVVAKPARYQTTSTRGGNVLMLQNSPAVASFPALATLRDHHDPGMSSARATVIRNEPLQHHTVQIQPSANG